MKFVNSIPFGRFGPRGFCRDEGPYDPLYARGAAPLHSPRAGAPPRAPGNFLPDEKVTKESPGAAPLGTRWCEISALFALAALRSGSRRATFCHRKRPICHFEMVSKPVFVVSFGFDQEKYSAVNPWLGGI